MQRGLLSQENADLLSLVVSISDAESKVKPDFLLWRPYLEW
jgi:hypothetical protein